MSILKFRKGNYISLKKNTASEGQEEEKDDILTDEVSGPSIPEGMFIKCPSCQQTLLKDDVVANEYRCYKCGGYFRIKAKNRLKMILDKKSFVAWDENLDTKDPLEYPDYREKLSALRNKTRLHEAVITGVGTIDGIKTVIGVCDARFLMGSMGQVVGEKITRAFERATAEKLPVILFCCSGGARMQEGLTSLMQMAKTSAAVKKHSDAGQLYISVLTDPTTGGVTASFAMLGDIILAEPGALIGFAGPRVIEQTIGQKLPEGFQRSEFLLEHGYIDQIVERDALKDTLKQLLILNGYGTRGKEEPQTIVSDTYKAEPEKGFVPEEMEPWERVKLSRRKERLTSLDYIEAIFEQFVELHGDRNFKDDKAIVGGLACLNGKPVTVIGIQKGRNTKENLIRNFGMPSPEGYHKALRLMKQAEKFGRPIITFVDTPGAFCGLEAEERGQGEAIARNLLEMSALKVPVLAVMIGEGGSGGALALAVGNEVWMMENATYSILSPEGFASILWKDSKKAPDAAKRMKMTAADLKQLGLIEKIIPEFGLAEEKNITPIADYLKAYMKDFMKRYSYYSPDELAQHKYDRFRRM